MTDADIKAMSRNGDSSWEILHAVVDSGVEYPDAVWKVSKALRMRKDEVAEMEDSYDNCI